MDIFRNVTTALNWTDSDWDFVCLNFNDLLKGILMQNNTYYAAVGGISVLYERYQEGYTFSIPTLTTGTSIIVRETIDSWLVFNLIEPTLGILLVITPLVTAILYFIFERRKSPFEEYLFHSYASVFFDNYAGLYRTSSRIVQVALWFLMLILISTYIANMTAVTSVNTILNGIHSPDDLNSRKVITYGGYNKLLYPYDAKPLNPENDDINIWKLSESLGNNDAAAYILDDPQAEIATWVHCDLYTRGRQFEPINLSLIHI
eukprot:TRINITY_DN10054_c0_g4_i1.p1 TRINITY_DN10054_c0_g4~~TRINITY_DN10054_c0_g4_i1.p1  ORF type:complete len:261 (-),score=43.22 TRINITY_DN10054_c0_g4_i1:61-843(-)